MARTLTPLNPLRAFEAAGRHLSFTAAAQELNVSQVAVSRQVQVLERYLDVVLVVRGSRSVQLTEEGARLLPALTAALSAIEDAVATVSMRGRRDVVSIQAYTTFAQLWLIPRLADFHARHPNTEIRLTASVEEVNFSRQNLDAVIASHPSENSKNVSTYLMPCHLLPVCSPELLRAQAGPLQPRDVRKFTMLHSLSRADAWRDWLQSADCADVSTNRGLKFSTSAMALEAALGGMGVAMGILELVHDQIAAGRLVAPFGHVHASARGYYIIRPADRRVSRALQTFSDWLEQQAKTSVADLLQPCPSVPKNLSA